MKSELTCRVIRKRNFVLRLRVYRCLSSRVKKNYFLAIKKNTKGKVGRVTPANIRRTTIYE